MENFTYADLDLMIHHLEHCLSYVKDDTSTLVISVGVVRDMVNITKQLLAVNQELDAIDDYLRYAADMGAVDGEEN